MGKHWTSLDNPESKWPPCGERGEQNPSCRIGNKVLQILVISGQTYNFGHRLNMGDQGTHSNLPDQIEASKLSRRFSVLNWSVPWISCNVRINCENEDQRSVLYFQYKGAFSEENTSLNLSGTNPGETWTRPLTCTTPPQPTIYMFKKYLNKIKITFLCQILSTILISLNSKAKVKKTPSL